MGEHTPERLKACPFCGSGSVRHSMVRDGRLVLCQCGAGMTKYHGPDGNTLKKVIDAWNTRTIEAKQRMQEILDISIGGPHMSAKDGFNAALTGLDRAKAIARAFLQQETG